MYRSEEPTLWCPECQTGVAQAEIDDKVGVKTQFTTIPFVAADGRELPIATTRPELLSACVAVMVNPDDNRYADFVGQTVRTPIFGHEVPVIADDKADKDKGTGAVMCCTFGDVTDVYWWRTHSLPLRIVVTRDGRLNELAGPYAGMRIKSRAEKDPGRPGRCRAWCATSARSSTPSACTSAARPRSSTWSSRSGS